MKFNSKLSFVGLVIILTVFSGGKPAKADLLNNIGNFLLENRNSIINGVRKAGDRVIHQERFGFLTPENTLGMTQEDKVAACTDLSYAMYLSHANGYPDEFTGNLFLRATNAYGTVEARDENGVTNCYKRMLKGEGNGE